MTEPTAAYCSSLPELDHTGCPSSIECYHVTVTVPAEDIAQVAVETLYARTRLAGWRPAELRGQADELEAGTHPMHAALAAIPGVLTSTIANMRAEAERIELQGSAAAAELATRNRNAKPFRGYVS